MGESMEQLRRTLEHCTVYLHSLAAPGLLSQLILCCLQSGREQQPATGRGRGESWRPQTSCRLLAVSLRVPLSHTLPLHLQTPSAAQNSPAQAGAPVPHGDLSLHLLSPAHC